MESDSLSRFASVLHSRHAEPLRDPSPLGWRDLSFDCEDVDEGEEEARPEFACPFCSEDFDAVGLCCHIDDEHPVEAKNGVCTICAASVGPDLATHTIMQHGRFSKHSRRNHKGASSATQSIISLLKKDFHGGNIQPIAGESSYTTPTIAASDPFLSSLIYTLPVDVSSKDSELESSCEISLVKLDEKVIERSEPTLSDKDQKELAMRSEFVLGMVLSTIFGDQ